MCDTCKDKDTVDLHVGDKLVKAKKLGEGRFRRVENGKEYRFQKGRVLKDNKRLFDFEEKPLDLVTDRGVAYAISCATMPESPDLPEETAIPTGNVRDGIILWGDGDNAKEFARVVCEAARTLRFLKATRIPFYADVDGEDAEGNSFRPPQGKVPKAVRMAFAEGPGAMRAALKGSLISADLTWIDKFDWQKPLGVHELIHNVGCGHCCAVEDLMTNPVGINAGCTDGDRSRTLAMYKSRGGIVLPVGPDIEPDPDTDPDPDLFPFGEWGWAWLRKIWGER